MKSKEQIHDEPIDSHLSLNESFWNERYQNYQMGWDMQQVSPPIKAFIDTIDNKELKILIPGCGNAHEAMYLLDNGFKNVALIDISSVLVNRLMKKFKDEPIQIIHGDFFEHKGKYDLILEQTFFCALDLFFRERYVQKCFDLLNQDGKLAGLLFNVDFGANHPPFGGSKEEYQRLFETSFKILRLDICKNSFPSRMGNELFFEFEKRSVK